MVSSASKEPVSTSNDTAGENGWGPLGHTILPIQIRPALTVYIQGLPHDITQAEARKVGEVIRAMASPAAPSQDDKTV